MRVKTFTGMHRAVVDKQVNDWLAETNVKVLGIAISVWHDEPAADKSLQSSPSIQPSGDVRLENRKGEN
jgi:hypothetical protein